MVAPLKRIALHDGHDVILRLAGGIRRRRLKGWNSRTEHGKWRRAVSAFADVQF
jgi:hypothetical protein